ncbi:hypothetical protein Neosp_014479 [[Neocosmospora] mangrovei]
MTWQAPLMCSAEPPMPSALCFRLRPTEDPFNRANQQTACVVQQRMTDEKAAPEDEPEVKHELGAENIPEVDNLHATEGNTETRK